METDEPRLAPQPDGGCAIYLAGYALATVISWSANKSILWAIGHGVCSWGYVIYYAFWGRS